MFFFKKNIVSFITIVNREFTRIIRIWPQTILPPIVTTILYFLIFGNLIGNRIGFMSGYSYMQYIVPGLIMMSIVTSSYANVVSSFFGSKFQRNIEELLISTTYSYIIVIGFVFGGLLRACVVGFLVLIISACFCKIFFYKILVVVCISILTSLLFSLFGLLNGIIAEKFDDISIVPTFVLTPLIYLGGIFYSIDLLPKFFRELVYLNPIFYIVNIFRYGILGISEVNISYAFFIMCLFIFFTYMLCDYLLSIGYKIKK